MPYYSLYKRLQDELIDEFDDVEPYVIEDILSYLVEMELLEYDILQEYYREFDA